MIPPSTFGSSASTNLIRRKTSGLAVVRAHRYQPLCQDRLMPLLGGLGPPAPLDVHLHQVRSIEDVGQKHAGPASLGNGICKGQGSHVVPAQVDLYPLRRILADSVLARVGRVVRRGTPWPARRCDVASESPRRWSMLTLSFVRVPTGADFRHRCSPVPKPTFGGEGFEVGKSAARPYASVGEELVRSDPSNCTGDDIFESKEGAPQGPTCGGSTATGATRMLRHLHPLPLVAAVGHIRRSWGRLQRVGGHHASGPCESLSCIGTLHSPASSHLSLGRPSWCLPTWHCSRSSRSSSRYCRRSWAAVGCHEKFPVHLAGRGPGHRPKGVADPPPCKVRPRSGSPRLLPSSGALPCGGASFEPQLAKLWVLPAQGPQEQPSSSALRTGPAGMTVWRMLLMMWVESSRCFRVRDAQRLDDFAVRCVSWTSQPATDRAASGELGSCGGLFWGRCSLLRCLSPHWRWCQSRLNSSCSRASSSVSVEHLFAGRWTPSDGLHRPVRIGRCPRSTWEQSASSSIRGSASFRKTSAQLLSRRLACPSASHQELRTVFRGYSCGSRMSEDILPSLEPGAAPTTFYYIIGPPCPRLARG